MQNLSNAIESSDAEMYGMKPENYRLDYCRRTDQLDKLAQFEVRETMDALTGRVHFHIFPAPTSGQPDIFEPVATVTVTADDQTATPATPATTSAFFDLSDLAV